MRSPFDTIREGSLWTLCEEVSELGFIKTRLVISYPDQVNLDTRTVLVLGVDSNSVLVHVLIDGMKLSTNVWMLKDFFCQVNE